jgi:hypothetical protein
VRVGIGRAAIRILYNLRLPALIAFCVIAQLAAVPIFICGCQHRAAQPEH